LRRRALWHEASDSWALWSWLRIEIVGLITKPQDRRNEPCPNLRELSDAELLALIRTFHDAGAPQILDRPLALEDSEVLDCEPVVAGLIDAPPREKV
jgi:hypothetical protein